MGIVSDPRQYLLCDFFFSKYLSKSNDQENFPEDEFPGVFQRYESLVGSALKALGMTKEALKRKPEFNFDSGDANNLESGIATLRVVESLRLANFQNISLIVPRKNQPAADLTCEKNQLKVCCEVKAITKQSAGRKGFFYEEQLYEKMLEYLPRARIQLRASAYELHCDITILACVVNWFEQSIYLNQADYQGIVDRLEKDGDQESLTGIDGVLFLTKMGQRFCFLNERGKPIDS